MPKKILCPKNLDFQPRPTYPYSPGANGGGLVFTSVPTDPPARTTVEAHLAESTMLVEIEAIAYVGS